MATTSKRPIPKLLAIAGLALLAGAATLTAARAASRHGGTDSGHERMLMRHHESKMERADTNGDGAVDAAEWNALFATIDTDKNGRLEGEELERHHGFPPPEALAFMIAHHADDDRDGEVTAAEWKAHVAEIDGNGDGALAADELHFRRRMPSPESAGGEAALPPFVTQWDTNRNGSLESSELDALFAAADEDGDGVLAFPHRERHFRR
jgi:Ca2+-binding EF-hand superfamily protein